MKISKSGQSLYFSDLYGEEKAIKIPSQMFPLPGRGMVLLSHENTSSLPSCDESATIYAVFNSLQPRLGACYSNTKLLLNALQEQGIEAVSMVGWLFIGDTLPIHHCLALLPQSNSILDFSVRPSFFHNKKYEGLSDDQMRTAFSRDYARALATCPNDQIGTLGQLDDGVIMVASECSPDKGLATFLRLQKAFPKHPAIIRYDADGATPTQRMILDRQKK